MSAVPLAPQALQDPDIESIEPPSVDREMKSGANLTTGLRALSTRSLDMRDSGPLTVFCWRIFAVSCYKMN